MASAAACIVGALLLQRKDCVRWAAICRVSRLNSLAAWPSLMAAQVGRSYGSAREALLLNAKFVAAQLAAQQGLNFDPASTPFIKSLLAEVTLPDRPSSHGMLTCRNPEHRIRTCACRFDCKQNVEKVPMQRLCEYHGATQSETKNNEGLLHDATARSLNEDGVPVACRMLRLVVFRQRQNAISLDITGATAGRGTSRWGEWSPVYPRAIRC